LSSVAVPVKLTGNDSSVGAVKLIVVSGARSPAIWALTVSLPWLVDDVVSPESSVARTVNV
jgi:hypothetical protein